MKALLICPRNRPAVALLAEASPLSVTPLLSKCLLEYWIEYLVAIGVREIVVVASDRIDRVETVVGEGARWGLPISVTPGDCEVSNEQVVEGYCLHSDDLPEIVVRMDHLPGRPGLRLFDSYEAWFVALKTWMPLAQSIERIGQYEVQPGVWVGQCARIDREAQLLAPCWLGNNVSVHGAAVIGPGAILEDGVVVAAGARVAQSVIGPATFVGAQTCVENSIAHRHTLINWTTNSCLRVPEAFWLSSLSRPYSATRPTARPGSMKIKVDSKRMSVTELGELSAANSASFREAINSVLSPVLELVDIDLSETQFLDSCGLASLCGLHRRAVNLGVSLRLLNPDPALRQLLELTQVHEFFEVIDAVSLRDETPGPMPTRIASALTLASAH